MSNIDSPETMEWKPINWRPAEKYVKKMQNRIYLASKSGDVKRVRSLQHTLSQSYRARLFAVRKVTQDNQGKKTAGVDSVKSIPAENRLTLAGGLKLDGNAKPARRVQIPKANGQIRNLGIPVMEDRAKQALAKLVLEPQWEANFLESSYGFRPGRSCHDAMADIFNGISKSKDKLVYEADLSKCFDEIDHDYLLSKVQTYPSMRRQIKAWLKAGVVIGFPKRNEFHVTDKGTPPCGVISPLLAKIALHALDSYFEKIDEVKLVRYADDFVLLMKKEPSPWHNEKIIKHFLKIVLQPIGLQ